MSFLKNIFGTSEENQSVSKVGWRQLIDLGQLNEIIAESTDKPVIVFNYIKIFLLLFIKFRF